MSRWITPNADDLKAIAHGAIMDKAATLATGSVDPIAEALENAVARVRRAVAAGNTLDADTTKVPASLKGVTLRLALYALMERIGLVLKDDQRETRKADLDDLGRLAKDRVRVEAPETPAGSGEMQEPGRAVEAVGVPARQTGRGRASGL